MLVKNMAKLQAVLPVLHSVLELETTTEPLRESRVTLAIIHLIEEIHLLVTLKEAD